MRESCDECKNRFRGRSIAALMARSCGERGFKYNASPRMGAVTTRTTVRSVRYGCATQTKAPAAFERPLTAKGLREVRAKLMLGPGVQAEAEQRERHLRLCGDVLSNSNDNGHCGVQADGHGELTEVARTSYSVTASRVQCSPRRREEGIVLWSRSYTSWTPGIRTQPFLHSSFVSIVPCFWMNEGASPTTRARYVFPTCFPDIWFQKSRAICRLHANASAPVVGCTKTR